MCLVFTMKLKTVLIVCLVQAVVNLSCVALKNQADKDSYIPGDHQLYKDTQHYIDPNDMLADVSVRRQAMKKKGPLHSDVVKDDKGPHLDSLECKSVRAELSVCNARQQVLELELQSKEATNVKVVQQLATKGTVDYELHYRRFLSLLLQALRSESGAMAAEGSLRRPLTFVLSEDVLNGLAQCVQDRAPSGERVRRCDELLTVLFHDVEVREEDSPDGLFAETVEWPRHLERLLLLLGFILVLLSVWASTLLVQDVWRNRRWAPFLLLMLMLTFAFCCLWNWRIMIKEVEAQRAADMERQGMEGPPEECRAQGFWAWLTGAHDKCTKYYTEVFIPASEQVTLEQVVVRTLTALLLSPLRALGRESGLFFNEFYRSVSLLYALPASVMLVIILMLFLYFCSRSSDRTPCYRLSDPTMESLAYQQLRRENQQLMLESRAMMESMGNALYKSAQPAQIVQPLLDTSYRLIERRLDSLIATRFEALTQQQAPRDPVSAPQCDNDKVQTPPRGQIASVSAADNTDGSRSAAAGGGNTSLDASEVEFVEQIMTVVNESISESLVVDDIKEAREEASPPNAAVRRRAPCNSTPLSPSAQKFLGEVREALES